MKRIDKRRWGRHLLPIVTVSIATFFICSSAVLALTVGDVEAQISATSKEAVSGNVLIWFLCAVAFLKVSQKIDSFMSSLGINVGHTGGNMLAEAMLATRGIGEGQKLFGGGGFGGRGSGGGGTSGSSRVPGSSGAGGSGVASGGFLSGGLAGAVGRQVTRSAVQNATGQGGGFVGGAAFSASLDKGGDFASGIVGTVAKGSIAATGTMTGDDAATGLASYLGYSVSPGSVSSSTASASIAPTTTSASTSVPFDTPQFSNVEIGGGRITGIETTDDEPGGIQFGMYNMDQYLPPEGEHSIVESIDGAKWYKQYATDTVDKSPYMAPDGSIAFNESIVKKMPRIPPRKDRV